MLFVSLTILALYAWARFIPGDFSLPIGLLIDEITAGVAAISSIFSLIFCFWLPKKHTVALSIVLYLLAVAVISTLIFTSGGLNSPFVSSWLIVALFAGFFGVFVAMGMAGLAIAQILLSYSLQTPELPAIITHTIFGIAPLILSFVLWHRQPEKKTDTSLRDLANRLSTVEGKSDVVINSIDDGVVAINRSGIIDLINPAAQALVGWNQGDALGLDWRSVFKLINIEGREVPEVENPIAIALATNNPSHSDKFSLLTGSDKKRLVSVVSSPVGSGEDGIIVILRDITKEKAEEREQAEFISTASHEMRTPVASIEGYLGLALNPATATIDEKARDFITKAHESARHLGELFQNLLDVSKAEDGRLKNEPQVIDVSAMAGDILEGLSHLAAAKQLRLLFKPNPTFETGSTDRKLQPVFYADVDPSHFREVVANLIENGIKYTMTGDVIVDVTGDDSIVTVSVQDTGIGIPAEDLPHLFQKFYRVDNSDTREIGGTGLGLYLCRRLAETMGGNLRVESEYKKGSTFFLDIPRISHEEAMRKLNELPDELPSIITQPAPLPTDTTQDPADPIQLVPAQDYTNTQITTPQTITQIPVTHITEPQPLPQPQSTITPQMSLTDIEAVARQPLSAPARMPIPPTPQPPEAIYQQPAPNQAAPQPTPYYSPIEAPVQAPQPTTEQPVRQQIVEAPPRNPR